MEGEAFLNYLWGLQPHGYHFLAWRNGKEWKEASVLYTDDAQSVRVTRRFMKKGDLYFCPNSFERDRRRKELCLPSRLMYQDLDESDPRDLPIAPELWWETSPGRYQAIWVLESAIEPSELQSLNRALNRACHADPGTWNLTRLLRLPGSWNAKRGCRVSRAYRGTELEAAA